MPLSGIILAGLLTTKWNSAKRPNLENMQTSLRIIRTIPFLFFFGMMVACSDNKKSVLDAAQTRESFAPPQITVLSALPLSAAPKKVFLKDVPKPFAVEIPTRTIEGFTRQTDAGKKKIRLSPPVKYVFKNDKTNLPIVADAQGLGLFTNYTVENGLALDQINCSFADKEGNLWFGSNGGGVSEYDGDSFTTFSTEQGLANNSVLAITDDKKGNLWFVTFGGELTKYDGKTFCRVNPSKGLKNKFVNCIAEDNTGNLWIGNSEGGAWKFDGKNFVVYNSAAEFTNNEVESILKDKKGNLLFATWGSGVIKYDGKNFIHYTKADGLSNDFVRCVGEDRSGNMWFGTWGFGISEYDGKEFRNFTEKNGLANDSVRSISQDNNGNLWFATFGGGVSRYDGSQFANFNTTQGLASNDVKSVLQDRGGNLWFSTFGGGISKYEGSSFSNFTTRQGLDNNRIWTIYQDKNGDLWLGTDDGGLIKYDGKSFTSFTEEQGLSGNIVYGITGDQSGYLWFGTFAGGVCEFDGRRFKNYTTAQGLGSNTVQSVFADHKGNLWFGTLGGGVSKFDGNSFISFTKTQGLGSDDVESILEDKDGVLWFGTRGGGLTRFDGSDFMTFTTAQGLANNLVWAITQDKNSNLWVGTEGGLSLMKPETLKNVADGEAKHGITKEPYFENYSTSDGLPDNFASEIVEGDGDKIYVGTNFGICELLRRNSGAGNEKQFVPGNIYNSQTGYPVKDVNPLRGMLKDRNGIIWIGTDSDKTGLVRFDPSGLLHSNTISPELVIKRIKINNLNVCWNDLISRRPGETQDSNTTPANITEEITTFGRPLLPMEKDSMLGRFANIRFDGISKWNPIPENLVLPYQDNNVSFEFNANETGKSAQVRYQYMLEGYDKDWSPLSNRKSAGFGNISAGAYTLHLRAVGPGGAWSKTTTFSFSVLPRWWLTWWMYFVYAVLAILFFASLVWWNNRRIIAQRNVLKHKISIATQQIRDEKDKVEETLAVLKNTQAQLIQSEKMASLGELTAGIAHEIQNPLNFVNNFSEVNQELIRDLKTELHGGNKNEAMLLADAIEENENKIVQHGKRADGIVKGMLLHSRSGSGEKVMADINAIAGECIKLTYHNIRAKDNSIDVQINTDFDSSIDKFQFVPQDMLRVFVNLFNNAFYAVAEKRNQHLNGYIPEISVSTKKDNRLVHVTIKDNGTGIPERIKEKIFQPFFTTKPTGQGTGLGLSLSYDIVKTHGGKMTVKTHEGEFTEFTIILPILA